MQLSRKHSENLEKWVPKESTEITVRANVRVARLQNEVGTRDLDRVTDFLTKNAPKFIFPKIIGPLFCGSPPKKAKIPTKFPATFPSPKFLKFTDELLQESSEKQMAL